MIPLIHKRDEMVNGLEQDRAKYEMLTGVADGHYVYIYIYIKYRIIKGYQIY